MKVFLAGINASYMHTCLAVRSIYSYVRKAAGECGLDIQIEFAEYTINQNIHDILKGIRLSDADVVLFSTYIWNISVVEKILPDVKKILPGCIIGAGGPEVSYAAEKYLKKFSCIDFIVAGEGEITVFELLKELEQKGTRDFFKNEKINVSGIYYLVPEQNKICFTGCRKLIEDFSVIPFSYPELLTENFDSDNKIYYFESSRGCPYSCSYCLSSIDKTVRFKSLEQTFSELQIFLDANVKLVKFVDRTYNLNPERYIKIWKYILEHHNKKTMFHFEIEAEYLSENAIEFLQNVPSGIMQFEIGVQSANRNTLKAINRSDNIDVLKKNILQIPKTIHKHLDLIAGLPYEDLKTFGRSFDFVMDLKPDALQIGFLKILHGTEMEKFAFENGWQWQENAVYETLSTLWTNYQAKGKIKDANRLVSVGHNIPFDHGFLDVAFQLNGDTIWKYLLNNYIDTFPLAKLCWGVNGDEKMNLTACTERATIKLNDAHGAMNDVEATADLLRFYMKKLRSNKGAASVEEEVKRARGQKFFEFACGK